jgi:hypothetical protein
MKRNLILINLILLATVLLLGAHFKKQWAGFQAQNNLGLLNPKPGLEQPGASPASRPAEVSNYGAIVESLLFSPDRNNFVVPDAPAAMAEQAKPKPVLTGIIGLGSHEIALMLPADARDSSDYRRLKVGDSIGAYKLVRCLEQKVVMSLDGKEVEIPISEPKSLLAREYPAAQPAVAGAKPDRVTSLGQPPDATGPAPAQPNLPPPSQVPIGTVRQGKVLKSFPTPFGPMNIWVDEK